MSGKSCKRNWGLIFQAAKISCLHPLSLAFKALFLKVQKYMFTLIFPWCFMYMRLKSGGLNNAFFLNIEKYWEINFSFSSPPPLIIGSSFSWNGYCRGKGYFLFAKNYTFTKRLRPLRYSFKSYWWSLQQQHFACANGLNLPLKLS